MSAYVNQATAEVAVGAVDYLLRRMQHTRDFPALSETISTLNRLSASGDKSNEQLAAVIVRDYALTNKILKVVNSAFYVGFAGKVGTVSRAIVVLGIEPIRALAASLMLFEHLSDGGHAERVKALIGKSMFSALLAREAALHAGVRQAEEAFLAAMFHNLGELLVAFYLSEEDAAIQDVLGDGKTTAVQAQQRVLGVNLDQLGIAVGRHWNLPKAITRSMQRLPQGRPGKPGSEEELVWQLACFADEATERIAAGDRPDDMGELLGRFADGVSLSGRAFADAVQTARSEYRLLAEGLATPKGAPGAIRALAGFAHPDKPATLPDTDIGDIALPQDAGDPDGASVTDPEPVLVEGLQEVTAMLAEGADLNQVAQVLLETLFRAFGLRRVALCLRDAARKEFVGRLGFGADVEAYLRALRVGEAYEKDVFHVALKQETDVHIADLAVGSAGHGIPPWYSALSPSGSMLFLPLVVQERVIGFVIAEHAQCNGLHLQAGTLRLVRALRNQLALGLQLRRSGRA